MRVDLLHPWFVALAAAFFSPRFVLLHPSSIRLGSISCRFLGTPLAFARLIPAKGEWKRIARLTFHTTHGTSSTSCARKCLSTSKARFGSLSTTNTSNIINSHIMTSALRDQQETHEFGLFSLSSSPSYVYTVTTTIATVLHLEQHTSVHHFKKQLRPRGCEGYCKRHSLLPNGFN